MKGTSGFEADCEKLCRARLAGKAQSEVQDQKFRKLSTQNPVLRTAYRFLHEQRQQFGTGAWPLLHTVGLTALFRGISTKREWPLAPIFCRADFIGIVLLLIIVFIRSTTSEAQEIEEVLFTSLPPEERSWAEKKSKKSLEDDKTLIQVDYVRLRSGGMLEKTLRAGLKGMQVRPFVLPLPNISPVTIVTTHIVLQSHGVIAWSGSIQGEQGSLVSIVIRESDPSLHKDIALHGTIFLRGRTFGISPAEKETYAIKEIDTNRLPPEGPTRVWKPKPLQKPVVKLGPPPTHLHGETSFPRPVNAEIRDVTPPLQNSCQIDVFVAYTSAAKAAAAAVGHSIDNEINTAIGLANATYALSDVKQWLNLVNVPGENYEACITIASIQTCYTEAGKLEEDLISLGAASPDADILSKQGDTSYPLTQVHTWRNSLGADIVALWVKGSPTDYCGQSETLPEDSNNPGTFPLASVPSDPYGFASRAAWSVVKRSCAIDGGHSMHHEFGHLGGAHHDRPYEASTPTGQPAPIEPDTLYSYGHIKPTGAYPTGNWRTIMGENLNGNQCPPGAQCCTSCTRIPNWSNPDVSHVGVSTGIKDQFPPPPPAPMPTNELSADNRTILNKSASIVAGFRLPQPSPGVCEGSVHGDTTPPAVPTGLVIR